MEKKAENGFPYYLYQEQELEEARTMEISGGDVIIATTCDVCGEPIEVRIQEIDNRATEPIMHSRSYHIRLYNQMQQEESDDDNAKE